MKHLIFISEFLDDAKFCFELFTMLVCLMLNYFNKIDHFTNSDRD